MGTVVAELELTAAMAVDCTAVATLHRQWNSGSSLIGLRERVHEDTEAAADVPVVLAKCEAVGMAGATARSSHGVRVRKKRERGRERERERELGLLLSAKAGGSTA